MTQTVHFTMRQVEFMCNCTCQAISMARTNISIDEEVAASLSDEATKENKTIYALSNESLKAILNICRSGGRPEDAYTTWMFTRILRDLDTVPTPGDLVEKLLRKLYEVDKEWLLHTWFEEGQRIGAYLHLSSPRMQDLSAEAKDISKARAPRHVRRGLRDGEQRRGTRVPDV